VRDTVRSVRKRATGEVVSAMDGVEDVWDDESAEAAEGKTSSAKKTSTSTSKPAAKKKPAPKSEKSGD
jgi:hypothetical protein